MAEVVRTRMKLSVSAFRAQATAQRKILKSYQNQLNYGSCSPYPVSGIKVDEVPHMMVDKTGIGSPRTDKPGDPSQSAESSQDEAEQEKMDEKSGNKVEPEANYGRKEDLVVASDKSPAGSRTKSNQRWMKLRTTVQLSGAISNTIQKSKPPLKREDSFLKRFSTRQIPETQETVDTGDETEPANGVHSQEEVNRRRRKRRKEQSKTVVNPDENFYFYWLMTVTVCVLYNLWTLIVRQSFPELQKDKRAFWYACDTCTDVVFVCDIVIQFRTGYLEQGLMVYDSKKLAKHYIKSRAFILDLITLIPLDLLQMEVGVNPILRLPRFFKIYRVYSYYYMVESRTVYPNLWRVMNLIHILLILAHWFGCFYYLLSEAEGFQGAWVYPYQQGEDATLTRKYLGSLYWSTLTLTTIGDLPTPETNAEYIFTIVSYLIGVFIFATIVGQVGNVITNRNANRLEFERLLDGAKTYMRHHKVPGGMKRRVLRWYDYSWSRGRIQGGGDINTALGLLPDKLKTELALHVNLSVLKKVTIFQECQPEFLHDLVLKMKAYIFTPGDLICRKGEIAREMFIIADGILDVISETGRVLTTMKAGDFFGEIGILNLDGLNKRTADVRSVGYSELFSLSREDVLAAMKDYPEAQEILQNLGRKRLMEAKNASKISKSQGRQTRDQGSPGDSDNAGKRIVEKLRSDVKGLKNALRRSRRETRDDDDDADGYREGFSCRTHEKRHSILRRMSHVQSSDEYEVANEGQVPVGVGLPLLHRLKLLKEKQEKEKEEWNKALKIIFPGRKSSAELEDCIPATQRLVSVKEKEDSDENSSEEIIVSPSSAGGTEVITAPDGLPSPRVETAYPSKLDSVRFEDESENAEKYHRAAILSGQPFKNGFCSDEPQKNAQHPEMPKKSKKCNQELINQETSIYVPKANGNVVNSVPKEALGIASEVPKYKERWSILRKSTESKGEDMKREGGCGLKGYNLVENCGREEAGSAKRSRSISPSDDAKNRKRTLRSTVENLIRERRRSRSLNLVDQKSCHQSVRVQWNESKAGVDSSKVMMMKKYSSIDDLSPEYSGLPFVKRLKILNERQKLVELVEEELGVRSASLDVPDHVQKEASLFRSRSLASTIDSPSNRGRTSQNNCDDREERPLFIRGRRNFKPEDRTAMLDMKQRFISMGSSGSLHSPESNETVERRHLKSILKKLSADDNNSDEDQYSRNRRRRMSLSRGGQTDLTKLMRAPTVEGYAARHTKLTKSVTFDSETLPSPTEVIAVKAGLEETVAKGLPPSSPTALLTLHLSNLSMIPIASQKKWEKKLDDATKVARCPLEILTDIHEELGKAFAADTPGILPYEKVVTEIGRIIRGHMEAINENLQSQFQDFQLQLKKRDELIYKLRTKIEELEGFALGEECCEFESIVRSRECSPIAMADLVSTREDACKNSFRMSREDENNPTNSFGTCYKQKSRASNGAEVEMREFDRTEGSALAKNRIGKSEAFEELELNELTRSEPVGTTNVRRKRENCSRRASADMKAEKRGRNGGIISRVTGFRKSMPRPGEFVAVEIESSSDLEELPNCDWEAQMLAEELSKNEWTTKQREKMRKLEDDVNELKKVVCQSNLTRFTASELDLLETILESKNQKISEIASSSCFDIAERRHTGDEAPQIGRRDRPPHRCKIGHALSFDFHDMENRTRPSSTSKNSVLPRKQKSTARQYRERHSMENLLNTSSFLKFRVLENSKNKMFPSKERSRNSFPFINSRLKNHKFRTSLPILSNRELERVNAGFTSSISSSDEAHQESCGSIFAENESEKDAPSSRNRFSGNATSSLVKEVEQNVSKYVDGRGRNGRREEHAAEKNSEIVEGNAEREETQQERVTKGNNSDNSG